MNLYQPKFRIVQPTGIRYMIQEFFYNKRQAQDYIEMLIEKSNKYINIKKVGGRAAPLMTIDELEQQLESIKKFKIIELERHEST